MKSDIVLKGLFTMIFAVGFCTLTPAMNAQNTQHAQQQNQPQSAQQQQKTFVGTVMKLQTGKYALVTGKTPEGGAAGHFLDDQKDAAKYAGKQVKVTGTLDVASNMIHVSKIRPA